jgi:hypothetical protein
MRLNDELSFHCPRGTILHHVERFGLQGNNATANLENTCPILSNRLAEIKLELDSNCSFFESNSLMDVNKVNKFKHTFDHDCLGVEQCKIKINSDVLPETCASKLPIAFDPFNNEDRESFEFLT